MSRISQPVLRRIPLFAVTSIFLFWSISLFVAPCVLPRGTVKDLDGAANRIDYAEKWSNFSAFPKLIYYLGDAECHQKSERSFELNGNQMPVCARDVALFVGLSAGLVVAIFLTPSPDPAVSILAMFPTRFRNWAMKKLTPGGFLFILLIVALVPIGLDGTAQLLTGYESTNLRRVLTGLLAGLIPGLMLGAVMDSLTRGGTKIAGAKKPSSKT
jgi:uncharacterized membrane protein